MPIISTKFLKDWINQQIVTSHASEVPIPEMDKVEIIEEVMKFSNDLDNLQIRLVPRKFVQIDFELSQY